jgi:hypothetical protein
MTRSYKKEKKQVQNRIGIEKKCKNTKERNTESKRSIGTDSKRKGKRRKTAKGIKAKKGTYRRRKIESKSTTRRCRE